MAVKTSLCMIIIKFNNKDLTIIGITQSFDEMDKPKIKQA